MQARQIRKVVNYSLFHIKRSFRLFSIQTQEKVIVHILKIIAMSLYTHIKYRIIQNIDSLLTMHSSSLLVSFSKRKEKVCKCQEFNVSH